MKAVNEKQIGKYPKKVSFSETLTFDISISSHVVGNISAAHKHKKTTSPK